jgi:hypothetical protein
VATPSATTATGSSTPSTASSSTTTARPATTPAISTAIRTIPRRPFPSTGPSHTRDRVTVEVGFVVGKISTAFDGQRRSSGPFAVTRLTAVRSRLATAHLRALLLEDGLPRKPNAIALNRKHFHQNLIAFLQFIAHIFDAMLSHFTDVEQPVGSRNDFDECPEIRQAGHRAQISLPYLGRRRQVANNLQRLIGRGFVV